MAKKIINSDIMRVIGHFEESEIDKTVHTYEAYFTSVSIDIDGDIIVSNKNEEA